MLPRIAHSLVLLASFVSVAGCVSAKPAEEGVAVGPSTAEPPQWETWPPADRVPRVRIADPSGPTVRLVPKEGGWKIDELFDMVSKSTGISFLYDGSNATFKQAKVEFVGVHVIPEGELFHWLQAVLSYRKLVLVPVGPKASDGRQQWLVMDQADPALKSRPVFVDESEILDYADRDGLYIVVWLRCRDTVDTTRVRNALSPLSTQTAGIGRIQDIPGSRSLVVGDFAPVVAAMKRVLDRINAETPPSAVKPPVVAPPAPAPAPAPKSEK